MTSAIPGRFAIPVRIALPSILILIGFIWFFYVPSQRLIQAKHAELEKHLAISAKSPKSIETLNARQREVQSEQAKIAQDCETLKQQLSSITARRAQWLRDSLSSGSPAKAVASTLELLRRNNLVCVDSGLIASSTQKEERFVSVQSKKSSASTNPSDGHQRTKYRIRLQGRFQDIRTALRQLQAEQPSVLLVSIDMDASDPISNQRNWTLVLNL